MKQEIANNGVNKDARKNRRAPVTPAVVLWEKRKEQRDMDTEMPRLDKTRLTISSLDDFLEEKEYWMSCGKAERLNAIEINRRMVYGTDRTTSRLQRVLETAELTRR
jgi:hypothetical protein